jgi:phosphate transport system protein
MGELAAEQFEAACEVVAHDGEERAAQVVARDRELDALESEVFQVALRLLALRQPMALDLRETLGAIRIASDLERIGDLAKNAAKRARLVHHQPLGRVPPSLLEMARVAGRQLVRVTQAYVERDAAKALDVWDGDVALDDWYEGVFREVLTQMMEDPRTITAGSHLLFIAKNIERIGDHCTSIAGTVHYVVRGEQPPEPRRKGADPRTTVVPPTGAALERGVR